MLLNRDKINALYWAWMQENLDPHEYTHYGRSEIVDVILSIIEKNDDVLLELPKDRR